MPWPTKHRGLCKDLVEKKQSITWLIKSVLISGNRDSTFVTPTRTEEILLTKGLTFAMLYNKWLVGVDKMLCLLVLQSHTGSRVESTIAEATCWQALIPRSLTMPCNHSGVGSHGEGISFDSAHLELNSLQAHCTSTTKLPLFFAELFVVMIS